MLRTTSKTITVPITSTATATESYSSQCPPVTRMTPPDREIAEAALCGGPPCAASVVQQGRSRSNYTIAAGCFSRISIRFRGPAFLPHAQHPSLREREGPSREAIAYADFLGPAEA